MCFINLREGKSILSAFELLYNLAQFVNSTPILCNTPPPILDWKIQTGPNNKEIEIILSIYSTMTKMCFLQEEERPTMSAIAAKIPQFALKN